LLGAVVWGAGLLAAHQLIAGPHKLARAAPSAGELLAAALLAAVLVTVWRSLRPARVELETAAPL
jgi:hypothetical protein